jgi:radical SAM superfamily enzyme
MQILARFPKGKIQLEIGLQSTHPETLDAVSRHIKPQAVIDAVRRVHGMGNIHVHLDLIAGLPFESYARFARSFDDAYGSCDLLQLGFLKLLHGTELRRRAAEYGYRALPHPPYTVLESRWISYAELQKLSHVAETLERFL